MKLFEAGRKAIWLVAMLLALGVGAGAHEAFVLVTDTLGNVWQSDNIADMAGQTASSTTGTLVRPASVYGNAYATDQDVTMDLTSHLIYRITGSGDVVRYATTADYIHNLNPTTVATAVYVGNKAVNGLSYDGAGTRFYSIIAAGPNAGDIAIYNTVTRFLAANQNSFMTTAGYTGAVPNFYDPDTTTGTSVGPTPAPHTVNAHFYQVAGNGRLEGFASLSEYDASSNNRINITGTNAFGGTGSFKAIGAFAVPAAYAYVPEATSCLIWSGILCGVGWFRRR
jgi:hypothetical protein